MLLLVGAILGLLIRARTQARSPDTDALLVEVYQDLSEHRNSPYLGIRRTWTIMDPPAPVLRAIRTSRPGARNASALVAESRPRDFFLVTVADPKMVNAREAEVQASYYLGSGGASDQSYRALWKEGRWHVQPEGFGCGVWKELNITGTGLNPLRP